MNAQIEYEIHPKEGLYLGIKIIVSVIAYLIIIGVLYNAATGERKAGLAISLVLFYGSFIVAYVIFSMGVLTGYLKGNAVKVSNSQFADINRSIERQAYLLGLEEAPDVYILQSGGILNAFATRFFGTNYIVLYSDVVEAAYAEDKNILDFIIGHELGHIKRKHMTKNLLLFPAFFVPFLASAYSRACEYTCDNIGNALAPGGARTGLLLLAGGRNLWGKINVEEYTMQPYNEAGFWQWFAEKVQSHPHLSKRVEKFREQTPAKRISVPKPETEIVAEEQKANTTEHNQWMPK